MSSHSMNCPKCNADISETWMACEALAEYHKLMAAPQGEPSIAQLQANYAAAQAALARRVLGHPTEGVSFPLAAAKEKPSG